MPKFLKKDFLNSSITYPIWSNLAKKLNFNDIIQGQVYKVKYSMFSNNELQSRIFIGVCLSKNAKGIDSQSFVLRNFLKIDSIEMLFFLNAPSLLSIECLKQYKRKTKFSKLYYLRKLKRKFYKV